MSGGGGSSNTYYSNLNELYAKQGAQLDRLMQIQDRNVIPGYDALSREAQQAGGIGEQTAAGSAVISQGRGELAAAKEATARDLTSMGVNPNDSRFVAAERGLDVAGAGQIAAGANTARTAARNLGFAKRKDVVGMGMGIPGQASEQMSAMGSTIGQQIAGRNQQDQARSAGLTSLGTLGTMALMMKNGGKVRRRGLYMARGGPVGGFFQPINAPQAPSSAPQQPTGTGLNPVSAMIMSKGIKGASPMGDKFAAMAEGMNAKGGHIAAKMGNLTGNQELTNQGVERILTSRGLDAESAHNLISGPQGLSPAPAGYTAPVSGPLGGIPEVSGAAPATAAAPAAEAGIGSLPGSVTPAAEAFGAGLGEAAVGEGVAAGMGAAGAEAAAAGAGTAAAGTAAAGAGTAALGAVSAAMPWIGAGIAVGSMLGLFADGGKVDMRSGGDVSGPGSGTSDSIPAHLSDGEFVLNAEAVKMVGEDKLNAINRAGLAVRKGGVRMADGGMVGQAGSLAEGIIRGMGISRQFENQNQERQLRELQMEQAQLGIEGARRDGAEKTRRTAGLREVEQVQSDWLAGRDPSTLNDNDVQAFRSLTASELVKRRLLNPDQVAEQLGALKKYADEGAFKAIQSYAQSGGDKTAALAAFNRFGNIKDATDLQISKTKGPDGLPDQAVRIVRGDGSNIDMTLSDLAISNGVGAHVLAQRKAAQESAKTAASIDKDKAYADYLRGRNETAVDVAETNAGKAVDVAAIRGTQAGAKLAARTAAGDVKQWTKWQDDLEAAKTVPQVARVDAEGNPIMQGMNAQYAADPKVMPTIRDLAHANKDKILTAGIGSEEFGQLGTAVHLASKAKEPTAMYEALDQTGKFYILRDKESRLPIGAGLLLGKDPDTGKDVVMRLGKSLEQKLLGEEARRADLKKRTDYPEEWKRMNVPGTPVSQPIPPRPYSRTSSGIIPMPGQYGEAETRRILGER